MTENIERKISWQHLTGALALIALVIVLLIQSADDGANGGDIDHRDPGIPSEGIPRGEAWDGCKQAVIDQLANPSTADFALLSTDFAEQADGGWSISGIVSAENAFGVEREIGYACEVSPSGAVDATVS